MAGALMLLGAGPDLGQEDDIVVTRRGAHEGQLASGVVSLDLGDLEELRDQRIALPARARNRVC